jgi:hypothetical protein
MGRICIKSGTATFYLLMCFIFIVLAGCEKGRNYPADIELLEGTWKVDEQSQSFKNSNAVYSVNIRIAPEDSSRIIISNFYQLGSTAEAIGKVEDSRIILLSDQNISYAGVAYTIISGSGTISDDYRNIDWQYKVDDGSGDVDNVTAIYTKQ